MSSFVIDTLLPYGLEILQNLYKNFENSCSLESESDEVAKHIEKLESISSKIASSSDKEHLKPFRDAIASAKAELLSEESSVEKVKAKLNDAVQLFSTYANMSTLEMAKTTKDLLQKMSDKESQPSVKVYSKNSEVQCPGCPTNLVYHEEDGSIILEWKNPEGCADIDNFEIWYDHTSKKATKTTKGSGNGATIDHLELGCWYKIKVRAINSGGSGPWSEQISVRLEKVCPSKPEIPLVTPNGPPTQVKVQVKVPDNRFEGDLPIDEVELIYKENITESKEHPMNKRPKGLTTCFIVDEIDSEGKYVFAVRVRNSVGWSVYSDQATYCHKSLIKPSPPKLKVSSKTSDTSLRVKWKTKHSPESSQKKNSSPPERITGFEIQMHTTHDKQWKDVRPEPIDGQKRSLVVDDLRPNNTYCFRIRALNDSIEGDWTDYVTGKTQWSKTAKIMASPAVFLGGLIATPFMNGSVAAVQTKAKVKGKLGTVAAIPAAIGAGAVSAVASPLFSAAHTHNFVHGVDMSSSSEDEE